MLYLLAASATGADEAGGSFVRKIEQVVSPFHPTCILSTEAAICTAHPGSDDGVAFVVGDKVAAEAATLLTTAGDAGAVVMPIALNPEHRRPPEQAAAAQSFDVQDALRRAGQPLDQIDWAARSFVREALSRLAPTCFRARLRLFLSYRRADGEGLTADLDRELSAQHDHVFRDLVDIQVGDPAQEEIDRRLREADVVVFVDTPKAGQSEWVARELATAMGNGIPIVWVRVGSSSGRVPLSVPPGEAPQIDAEDQDSIDANRLATDILDAALDQVREAIRASMSAFGSVRTWAGDHQATVAVLDQRRLIYAITMPPDPAARFPRRVRRDIVQVFARNPDEADIGELTTWLKDNGYADHPVACRAFDAAILIRPGMATVVGVGDWGVVASGRHYVGELAGIEESPSDAVRPTMLVLGAFPSEPASHPVVISAVSALVRSWLVRGGSIRFGSHPTFTPLIAEAARAVLPEGSRDRIEAFRSAHFPPSAFEVGTSEVMTVQNVADQADLAASLTVLRAEMIQPNSAAVAVLIGGRTVEDGNHMPGIEEEYELARRAGLPVVAVGSSGGQAAVIAKRERLADAPWAGLGNGLTDSTNESLADSDDYADTAHTLWEAFAKTH